MHAITAAARAASEENLTGRIRRLSERAGSPEGTGLGLSIVRSVAVAHHGQITARSRPAGGLEVSVLLPACPRVP